MLITIEYFFCAISSEAHVIYCPLLTDFKTKWSFLRFGGIRCFGANPSLTSVSALAN